MGIFRHENMELDLTVSSKAKLYKDGMLMFMGDGYKAILSMINNSKDQEPVREKFYKQLTMREKPKFTTKGDDLEALRKEAHESFGKQKEEKTKKRKTKNQWDRMTK